MKSEFTVHGMQFDELDMALVLNTQGGMPLVSRPYLELADKLNTTEEEILRRLKIMKDLGFVRKIAATPNHYKIGYVANAMTVWDVPDESIEEVGNYFKSLGFISHCYIRPRRLPDWPYNLFAMVHGHSKEEVNQVVAKLQEEMRGLYKDMTLLYSTKILKKTGIRLKVENNV